VTDRAQIPADFAHLLDIDVATFATVGPTGYPQVSAIAFLAEDGVIKTSMHPSRQKYINAVREGKATYFFVDPADQYRTLEVRGDITVEDDADLSYLAHQGEKYGRTVEGFKGEKDNRKVVILTPTRARVWEVGTY